MVHTVRVSTSLLGESQRGSVRLTHLDLGNNQLQLVEPLTSSYLLQAWLAQHGPGLHHCCLRVADVDAVRIEFNASALACAVDPHQGTLGKRAVFLANTSTQGVKVEITGS